MSISTRAALIGIARRNFGELGYSGISIEDITTAAQLTRGALYHHFGSKSGLFHAVVDSIDEEIDEMFQARLEAAGLAGQDSWQQVRIAAHCYLEAVRKPDVRQIVLLDAPVHYAGFVERSVRLHCRASTVSALERLIALGQIRSAQAAPTAYMIEGAISGLISWASDFGVGLDDTLAQFDAFLAGLAAG